MPRKSGFTLVELLVVIAIIAVLITFLAPALQKAKEQGRAVICKNNLKAYGITMRMYLDDNEGYFPHPYTWLYANALNASAGGWQCLWHDPDPFNAPDGPDGTLWPYFSDRDIHLCKTLYNIVTQMGTEACQYHGSSNVPISPQFSYSMNCFLHKAYGGPGKESGVQRHPAEVVSFVEETPVFIPGLNRWLFNDNVFRSGPSPPPRSGMVDDCIGGFHKTSSSEYYEGVTNAVFLDYHVEEVIPESTYTVVWPLKR
jgi:prepilin-type N-terminal cleavage/methylation domain-containing protein